jgi:hypothetical protein
MKMIKKLCLFFTMLFISGALSCAQNEASSDLQHDPIENDPRYKAIIEQVDQEIEASLKKDNKYGEMGSCYMFWAQKKKILKERYNIDWKSPSEMNPQVLFD